MERNHNKTASQEKSLEEMRRGFNSKAEDMFKSNNICWKNSFCKNFQN